MKKRKIVNIIAAVIAICCSIMLGIFIGKTSFFGLVARDHAGLKPDTNFIVGQDLNFTSEIDTDILSRHLLPSLERMEKSDQEQYVNSLQVIKKVELLGIGKRDFLYPEIKLSDIEKSVSILEKKEDEMQERIVFQGTTSEELQQIINENANVIIDIKTEQIQLFDTITLHDNITINGNGVQFVSNGLQYGIICDNASNVYINDVYVDGNLDYGIYFVKGSNVNVFNSEINGCIQKALCIVGDTKGFKISGNRMSNNMAGTIYIAGDASTGIIENNNIINSCGTSNWMAGIVFTSDNPENEWDIWNSFDGAHRCPYREKIYEQIKAPHDIVVKNNFILNGNSSGIYSDGAYSCYIIGNTVKQNDKEGICLDNGTIGFYVKENVFEGNGQRIRQTDADLEMDFVLESGRMEDGSAKSKLPGISLDNTAYNILENNIVINNYGGGIKMVRTTVRTLIMENIIKDNNIGQNDSFHFFGIEVGAASAGSESTDMDFAPDYENIICRNSISGNHYAGIFVGEECYVNDIFDNVIMEPQMFAVEAISKKFNSIVNNISSVGIRNEYSEN